jgi:hypothetical protein
MAMHLWATSLPAAEAHSRNAARSGRDLVWQKVLPHSCHIGLKLEWTQMVQKRLFFRGFPCGQLWITMDAIAAFTRQGHWFDPSTATIRNKDLPGASAHLR